MPTAPLMMSHVARSGVFAYALHGSSLYRFPITSQTMEVTDVKIAAQQIENAILAADFSSAILLNGKLKFKDQFKNPFVVVQCCTKILNRTLYTIFELKMEKHTMEETKHPLTWDLPKNKESKIFQHLQYLGLLFACFPHFVKSDRKNFQ